MDSHSLEILDFPMIRRQVAGLCLSREGADLVETQPFMTDRALLRELKRKVGDFHGLLDSGIDFPDLSFPDLGDSLRRLAKNGAVLEAPQLADLGITIRSGEQLRRFLGKQSDRERLQEMGRCIPDLGGTSRDIFRIVDPEGRVREKQIPELKEIMSRLGALKKELNRLASAYLNNPDTLAYWQERQPTQRDGRTVVPLKTNFKGRVQGIVHEISDSGATLFLEPLDMVELNNEVVQCQGEYRNRLLRILRDATARMALRLPEIRKLVEAVAAIDSVLARAKYSVLHECTAAGDSEGDLRLYQARHPLLKKDAVPVTVALEKGCRMLIITGPNMGGKTVTLKTVGLLSLMNQFGMEIPAQEGSLLPVFDDCFADIGDEQSLEQSLSTFSAHICNLRRMADGSTSRSLVLLDELGAGTDPEEGTAIAMSLLDSFIEKGCVTLATTHHSILKHYGYTRPGVLNASMEFDKRTLRPTFRVIIGVPGESYALEIARQVGMDEGIVARAESYLGEERSDISELLSRLTVKEQELLETEKEHERRERELEAKKEEADRKLSNLMNREKELRERGLTDLRDFLSRSRQELDGLIRSIREGELSREKTRTAHDFLEEVRRRLKEEESRIQEIHQQAKPEFQVKPGMAVQVASTGKRGRVIRRAKGNRWVIATDRLKITLEPGDFAPAPEEAPETPGISASVDRGTSAVFDLDVRGMRYEEALRRLEKQIDSAVLSSLHRFSVIHGKGEGILQKAVHQVLSEHPSVDDYSFARPEDGGHGKTIVVLKTG